MYNLDNLAGRTALVNGKEYLFFSGYSYLGMSDVPEFARLVKEGIDTYGLLHPSARISNTQLEIYNNFERQLSVLTGKEETVSFSSGYLAGRAVAELFIEGTEVIVLENTHPVLRNGCDTFSGEINELIEKINGSSKKSFTIVGDSINPLKAIINDYSFLNLVDSDKTITCIIDDSHGIGLIGENGSGISSSLPRLPNVDYIVTYSLSKAFHVIGGAVSCSKDVAERLRQSPFYTSSTAIAPSMVYAFIKGFDYYETQQKNLQENINYFIHLIKDVEDVFYNPSLPIFVLPEKLDDAFFDQHKIIISSFSYPDPTGNKINRIVLNALHTKEDLEILSSILHQRV